MTRLQPPAATFDTTGRDKTPRQPRVLANGLHFFMCAACLLLLAISVTGSWLTSDWSWHAPVAAIVLLPISAFPAILRHDRRHYEKRDAALTLPWVVLLVLIIPCIAGLSGKLGLPLRDALFVDMDNRLGFNIPSLMAWISKHWLIKVVLDRSYPLLFWLLPAAILIPALAGKREAAERFLLANTIAFVTAMPIFALLPAIGPWAGYHFLGTAEQQVCESSIYAFRMGGRAAAIGIVCFPSFHVIWAVLSASALRSIKALRVPSAILATLIVISTMTTGWHYVVDVLAGLLLVGVSIVGANAFLRWNARLPAGIAQSIARATVTATEWHTASRRIDG